MSHRLRRGLILLVATIIPVVVLCIPVACGLHWWFLPSRPTGSPDEVTRIDVRLYPYEVNTYRPPGYAQKEAEVSITDEDQIRALLEVFDTAKRASEHHCASSGSITIHKKNGSVETVEILPGHDPAFYEYRMGNRINRVDRDQLLAALKAAGIEGVKTEPP